MVSQFKMFFYGFGKKIQVLKLISRCYHNDMEQVLSYGQHIISAKQQNLPIVALESAIITHGMPYPDNLDTVLAVENIIRQKVGFSN